jgi:hypothetical protein
VIRPRRQSQALNQVLAGQMSLFAAYSPPSFDEMCPPPRNDEQLGFDVDAAVNAANQTTVYDFTPDA